MVGKFLLLCSATEKRILRPMPDEETTRIRRVRRQHWKIRQRRSFLGMPTLVRDIVLVIGTAYIFIVFLIDVLGKN